MVNVNIRVCRHLQTHVHRILANHEAGGQHGLGVVVLVVDRQPIVATHLQAALAVGNLQPIVGVEHVGVKRFLDVVDGVSLSEATDILAAEESFRGSPVGLAMLHLIGVATIFVCQVVEADVDHLRATQLDDGQVHPSRAGHHLQRGDVGAVHLVTLSLHRLNVEH